MAAQKKHSSQFHDNLERYEQGQLDNLPCPRCSQDAIGIYFDGPKMVNEVLWTRVYFFCHHCKEWDRISYKSLPPHFTEKRDIVEIDR